RAGGPGETREQRADREQRDAQDQQAPPTQQVGEPATEQEHTPEDDRVGRDHPLEVGLGEVQIRLDGRKGDIHDRDVHDDHELGADNDGEGEPAPVVGSRRSPGNEGIHAVSKSLKRSMITTSNDMAGYAIPVATAPPRAPDDARAPKIPEDLL